MWRCITVALCLVITNAEGKSPIASATLSQTGQTLVRNGQWYRFNLGQLPEGYIGTIRAVSWQITSTGVWHQPPRLFLCLNQYCQLVDGLAGRSTRFAGLNSRGRWQFNIRLADGASTQQPLQVNGISLTVDSRIRND